MALTGKFVEAETGVIRKTDLIRRVRSYPVRIFTLGEEFVVDCGLVKGLPVNQLER